MTPDDLPEVRRVPPPEPDPREVRFQPKLTVAPFVPPKRQRLSEIDVRRAKADHLCLWLACSRALCRRTRHCLGIHALCVFEQEEVDRPLLGVTPCPGRGASRETVHRRAGAYAWIPVLRRGTAHRAAPGKRETCTPPESVSLSLATFDPRSGRRQALPSRGRFAKQAAKRRRIIDLPGAVATRYNRIMRTP